MVDDCTHNDVCLGSAFIDHLWTQSFFMNHIQTNILLKDFSTFKIGGKCRYFCDIRSVDDLYEVSDFIKKNKLNFFILGGGSNTLFSDKFFDGIVLRINLKGIEIKESQKKVSVSAYAGEVWDDFVAFLIRKKIYGLENLSLIPGTVGASPVQNIGAYGVEVSQLIDSVTVFDLQTKKIKVLKNKECLFGYRTSIFKKEIAKKYIVIKVCFKLSRIACVNTTYKDLSLYVGRYKKITPQLVRKAVTDIRKKKFPDLSLYGTAGSFFKNIVVSHAVAKKIKKKFPDVPVFVFSQTKSKISTAFVLDKICGFRGVREGDVGTFENQTLVIVNYGNATSNEVKKFVKKIKNKIKQKLNLILEEEVIIF